MRFKGKFIRVELENCEYSYRGSAYTSAVGRTIVIYKNGGIVAEFNTRDVLLFEEGKYV